MKRASKTTQNWWMIFNQFPPEPYKLWQSYLLATSITLILFSVSAFIAYGVHGSYAEELTITRITGKCKIQSEYWEDLLKKDKENKEAATERSKQLKKIRFNPNDKTFSQPWSWFESELTQLEKVEKSNKYRIPPIAEGFQSVIALVLFTLLFYIFLSRLIILHAKSTYGHYQFNEINQDSIRDWKTPQILIGIVLIVPVLLSELCTSVLAEEKTWFGYDSFCVTPAAFVVKCIAFVASGFVSATPFTMLWCLSRRDYIPHPDMLARDGKFGAERYVEFLQTWTLWLILAPSALGIFFFRYVIVKEDLFSPVRLIYGLGVGIIILLIIVRLIRNAVILRFLCREILVNQKHGATDQVPIDPTIDFLGKDWWKLPATISVSLASIWVLLELMGLSKILVGIVQKSP